MELANIANHYIAEAKPWELAKNIESNSEHKNQVLETCTLSLNLFKVLSTYLQPILPTIADQVALFLNLETLEWNDIEHLLLNHKINKFKPLLQRLQTEDVEKITV